MGGGAKHQNNICSARPGFGNAQLQRLIHFAGKSGMDFEGLGKKQVELLLNTGLIEDAADFFIGYVKLKKRKE